MNREPTGGDPRAGTLTPTAALRVDALCDRFESDWAAGRRPRIEDLIGEVDPADRPAALRELIRLEVALRRARGESPAAVEYESRFSDQPAAVASAFSAGTDQASSGPLTDPGLSPERDDRTLAIDSGDVTLPTPVAPPGYEILGLLGRGGMGVVYRARQVRLKREVALKMVLAGSHASEQLLARFLAEAEAIAKVRHPNVVQVYDLGDHDGLPYFAMEYHPAGSLARRLDGTPRPPREAARLVEGIAMGVAEAHRAGLVHRDLKPANVLIARDRTPCVADFGLVKALDSDSGLTRTDLVLGTPSYMAPEQARGLARNVGPAADVYAMGAIFYELLTGRAPFKAATSLETLELVKGTDPMPPRRLVPGLPRDAETIALTCLRKEPARRYSSAEALAEDLRRLADGRPILARPVGGFERGWRWCRRRPVVASLALALAVTLIAGLSIITSLWLRAEGLRSLAEKRLTLAEESYLKANEAIDQMFNRIIEDDLLDSPGVEPFRRELLTKARDGYLSLISGYAAREQDAVRPILPDFNVAVALMKLANIEFRMGDRDAAIATAHSARERLERLAGVEPGRMVVWLNLIETLNDLHKYESDAAKSREAAERAASLGRKVHANWPEEPRAAVYLARALGRLGVLASAEAGDHDAGAAMLREAIDLARPAAESQPGEIPYAQTLRQLQGDLATIELAAGRFDSAVRWTRASIAGLEEELVRKPRSYLARKALAARLGNLAGQLSAQGRLAESLAPAARSVELFEGLAAEHPGEAELGIQSVATLANLAEIQRRLAQPALAESTFGRTISALDRLLERDSSDPYLNMLLGAMLGNYGEFLQNNLGRPEDSLAIFDRSFEALGLVLARSPKHAASRGYLRNNLAGKAEALEKLGRASEALGLRDRAIALADSPEQEESLRRERALTLALAGDHRAAAEDAARYNGPPDGPPKAYLDACLILSRAARSALADASLDPETRRATAEGYLDDALAVLRRADAAGQLAGRRRLDKFLKMSDLEPLRARPEVRAILDRAQDRAFPLSPFAATR